ncbi:unnamed protein product, partial [Ectocarpus sp. 12 AP-2014]
GGLWVGIDCARPTRPRLFNLPADVYNKAVRMSAGVGLAGLLPRAVCDVLQGGGTHGLVCVPDCFLCEVCLVYFLESFCRCFLSLPEPGDLLESWLDGSMRVRGRG